MSSPADSEDSPAAGLSHVDDSGEAHMVDVSAKKRSLRRAVARGCVRMRRETHELIVGGAHPKGSVLGVARIAGIQAAKQTGGLIPLCHPLALDHVRVDFAWRDAESTDEALLEIEAEAVVDGKTGVEMEALTAVSVAALTVYDMVKAVDRGIVLESIRLVEKEGGKSGHWRREK